MQRGTHTIRGIKPIHLLIFRDHMRGHTNREIASLHGITEQSVCNILQEEPIQELKKAAMEKAFDTLTDVQESLQLAAPFAIQTKISLLSSSDDRVRNMAATDILQMSGHRPASRLIVEHEQTVERETDNKSEEELRNMILKDCLAEVEDNFTLVPTGEADKTVH